jgi:hypothetical protein
MKKVLVIKFVGSICIQQTSRKHYVVIVEEVDLHYYHNIQEQRPLKIFPSSDLPQLLMDSLHRHDLDFFVRREHTAFSFLHDEAKHLEVTRSHTIVWERVQYLPANGAYPGECGPREDQRRCPVINMLEGLLLMAV